MKCDEKRVWVPRLTKAPALLAVITCSGLLSAACVVERPTPAHGGQGASADRPPPSDDTLAVSASPGGRGMGVESAPFTLELWPSVSGSQSGPLVNEMSLASGDRVSLSASASAVTHLYLVFCDGERKLTRYPTSGSIVMPEQKQGAVLGTGNLVLDDNPGREALYVIASRRPLDQADPQLDKALATARPGDASADCGSRFERLMAGPTSPPSTTQIALPAPATAPPATATAPKPPRASAHALEFERPPVMCVRNARAEIVRGMGVEGASGDSVKAASNAEGVVVLRFGFEHRPKHAPTPRGATPLLAPACSPQGRSTTRKDRVQRGWR